MLWVFYDGKFVLGDSKAPMSIKYRKQFILPRIELLGPSLEPGLRVSAWLLGLSPWGTAWDSPNRGHEPTPLLVHHQQEVL